MLISSIILEASAKERGRPFNHVEDLVLFNGSTGALRALALILQAQQQPNAVRWKWDGKPQVYWGRDTDGSFIMTGHNGWLKPDQSGKVSSARDLAHFIMNTGKASTDTEIAARQQFSVEFASLWPLFEAATPADFRGFVYGDLLYMRRPALVKGEYVFTPNKVTYHVKSASELGTRIARSTAAVVGHAFFNEFGLPDRAQKPITNFEPFNHNPNLIVMGPQTGQTPAKLDNAKIKHLHTFTQSVAADVDRFLDDSVLQSQKMTGFKDVLYKFNNQMAKSGVTVDLANRFIDWINRSSESAAMKQKLTAWISQNAKGFKACFAIMEGIRAVKNDLIAHFDNEQGAIRATTGAQPGGEGYVLYNPEGNVKFVPRHRWTSE